MGELILCRQMLAAMPFYIEEAAVNVYSLEELGYLIEHNLYLIGPGFMSWELCDWIEHELSLKRTAEQMRKIRTSGGSLADFVACMLADVGYFSRGDLARIYNGLEEMGRKSQLECAKLRADYYMENGRYVNSIYEYRRLLQRDGQEPRVMGDIWHNLGTAYARLFLFREAYACCHRAYELNGNRESVHACLFACRCMQDEELFGRTAAEFQVDPQELQEIGNELTEAARSEEIRDFEANVEALFEKKAESGIRSVLEEWKNMYRKKCRV